MDIVNNNVKIKPYKKNEYDNKRSNSKADA